MTFINLTFVSTSDLKYAEIVDCLRRAGITIPVVKADLTDVQLGEEIQRDRVEEVAMNKATSCPKQFWPALIEDTGLHFTALNGLPGPFIKFFEKSMGPENIPMLLMAFRDKSAVAVSSIAYVDARGVKIFTGETRGRIVSASSYTNKYENWDCIFVPDGDERTFADMTWDEKYHYSPRAKAVNQLAAYLTTIG